MTTKFSPNEKEVETRLIEKKVEINFVDEDDCANAAGDFTCGSQGPGWNQGAAGIVQVGQDNKPGRRRNHPF